MPTTIAGIYREGRVDLLEVPTGVREVSVQVTLTEDQSLPSSPHLLLYGKYGAGWLSTEEDFAEWHEEAEPGDRPVRD